MGWNNITNFMLAHQQAQNEEAAAKKAAAEAAQSQYLQSMLKQYGFSDPLEVKEGLWDRVTPWQTDSEKARPYAEQLLQNSALAVDQDWYNQNVVPNQKTGVLQNMEKFGNVLNSMPMANISPSYNTEERGFQNRNPYAGKTREDLMNQQPSYFSGAGNPETAQPAIRGTQPMGGMLEMNQQPSYFSGAVNPEMAQPAIRGAQPMSGVLDKKTNTEKFLEYLKQSAGAKL